MSECVIYKNYEKPVDVSPHGDGSALVTGVKYILPGAAWSAEKQLYDRRDLFVKSFRLLPVSEDKNTVLDPTVFIQDSIERQNGGKIASFVRRINDVVVDAQKMASGHSQIVPYNWKPKEYHPTVIISLKCPDTKLGPKSQKIISALDNAVQSGVKIEFINKYNEETPWNQVIKSIIEKGR